MTTDVLRPVGSQILIRLIPAEEKTKGGIIVAETLRDRESAAAVVALVVALGPDCYLDKRLFPTGPWCKAGDHIVIRSYSGTRLRVEGDDAEYRFITDESVEGVTSDPAKVKRALKY